MTKNKLKKLLLSLTILSLTNCSISARNPLDSSQPLGVIYQLLPIFFPHFKPSSAKAVKTYFISESSSSGVVKGTDITITVPYSTNLDSLTAEFYQIGQSITVNSVEQISGETKNNYNNPLVYRVRAADTTTLDYIVKVSKGSSTSNDLLSFSLSANAQTTFYEGIITGNLVTVYVPNVIDITSLIAVFSQTGKKVQANGIDQTSSKSTQSFSNPVVYSVFAESGAKKDYTVGVTVNTSNSKDMKAFWLGSSQGTISGSDIIVPITSDKNIKSLVASFIHTGSSVKANGKFIVSGESIFDYTHPVVFTISAGDGSTKDYRVIVTMINPATSTFAIGGLVGGLSSGTLSLQNNGGDTINLTANGSFTFPTSIAYNNTYNVTVSTQPSSGQTCTISNGSGTATASVSNIAVSCSTPGSPTYTISGNVIGLTGTVVLQNNGGDSKSISANGAFTFTTSVANLYSVTVLTQPTGQTCTVTSGTGTASANVSNVSVNCAISTYTIGGFVSGLTGTVVLQNNGGDNKSLIAGGNFFFNTSISYNGTYNVAVLTNPTNQYCTVANGTGTVTASVTNIIVDCNNTPGTTVQSFTDLGNQTIKDNNTGLVWMKCSMSDVSGAPLTGSNCLTGTFGRYLFCREDDNDCNGGTNSGIYGVLNTTGFSGTYPGSYGTVYSFGLDHYTAYKACNDANITPSGGFAGKTTWRVPTRDELTSLVDYNATVLPMINTFFFPNTTTLDLYWSSTSLASDRRFTWAADFDSGLITSSFKSTYNYVRCVSGP